MTRGERVKIVRQELTGVSDVDYKSNSRRVNGLIEQVLVTCTGDVEYDLDIKPKPLSGLSAQNIVDVKATGTSVFYPRVNVLKVSGTAAAAGDNLWGKIAVDDQLDFNAAILATGSTVTVRVYYI